MATYAAVADMEDDRIPWTTTNEADVEALLQQAELDIDAALGPVDTLTEDGLKLDPATLPARDAIALKWATCFQAVYRHIKGPTFFLSDQYEEVWGPDFRTKGKLSRLSPLALEILADSTLPVIGTEGAIRWARAVP